MNHEHLATVAASFMPHGHCWAWTPGILWMMVLGNALTALSYYSIPIVLFRLVRGRQDLPYPHLFVLFGLFILFCGTGHLIDIVTIWHPFYWLDAIGVESQPGRGSTFWFTLPLEPVSSPA